MDSHELLMKEYQNLRNEIIQVTSLHNTLLTFTITTTIAVLSFVFAQDSIIPFLFLLPFCIIIPMSMRIAYYRTNMAKISAYIIVFIETEIPEINWETRNRNAISGLLNKNKKQYTLLSYFECLLLCIICYVLFAVFYIIQNAFSIITFIHLLWPLVFVAFECFVTKQMCSVHKEREKWIKIWKAKNK